MQQIRAFSEIVHSAVACPELRRRPRMIDSIQDTIEVLAEGRQDLQSLASKRNISPASMSPHIGH